MKEEKSIVRSDRAGVFYGIVTARRGAEVDLKDVRRIYYWSGATDCIQIAQEGCSPKSRLTMAADSITIFGVIEVLPVSEKARVILDGIPAWKM